jgi:P-type conjugative transfer protein TrbJ
MRECSWNTHTRAATRGTTFAAILVASVAATPPAAARAQIPIPGLGGLIGGLLGGGPQIVYDPSAVGKLVTQLDQIRRQIGIAQRQLQAQVDNMRKLSNPPWRTINATLAQVDALAQQGQALGYALADLDAQFRQTFPGWQLSGTMAGDMRAQNERTLATLRGALGATGATARQFPTSAANLQAMKRRMATITSAQQAAELNGSIGIQGAEELTLLRQQLAAMNSAQLVVLAQQINHQLQAAAFQQAYDAAAQIRRPAPPRRNISGWAF